MLKVNDLKVEVEGKSILKGLTLNVGAGEVHAIMGPNGSGKSTLSHVLSGREGYEVVGGSITLDGEDLLALSPEERAWKGLFLGFQYPVAIPGLNSSVFMREAVNAVRRSRGESEYDAMDFLAIAREKMKLLEMDESFMTRAVNDGFSGGEKKRNEIYQMALLEPRLAILDEIDSGLDIDALRIVSEGINKLRSADRSFILVTHYQRLLDYVVPDYVHVLSRGVIVRSGGRELALELESSGYGWLENETAQA
ncbi:MAG: Fe-S cluster assembly ATPase SufC [Gammaproteobacteria bacterium]|nr:MAG: Fe-S cluster assembly ATPase SufC [Gammaproteobacteria bacterium]RLA13267.1 MAG: Fe-S cluster assembly ATPase SufC [Gammaproteobacteria bacterium]